MNSIEQIATNRLDMSPDPVLVKDSETRYVWVNAAFEGLFHAKCEEIFERFDRDRFPNRQVAQGNGAGLRVLATGSLMKPMSVLLIRFADKVKRLRRKFGSHQTTGKL